MTEPERPPEPRPTIRFQRLAEQVADDLRQRILIGDLNDGSELPKEQELRSSYPVSKPTLREAMRILEAEGLVTVRRGSVGGAVVHRPAAANVAYTLGLVLAAERVSIDAVGQALQAVEPDCAALCALRPDRSETVVPVLRALHERSIELIDDLVEVTAASRGFHEEMVALCGNQPLIILAGALEAVWSIHESGWARRTVAEQVPRAERLAALEVHAVLIDHIDAGDAEAARHVAAEHLGTVQMYPSTDGDDRVDVDAVRKSFLARNGKGPRSRA